MKISYVTLADGEMASYRYRIDLPARELAKNHHFVTAGPEYHPEAEIVCFSKHFNPEDIAYAARAKEEGRKVLYDVADNHFDGDKGQHYRDMIALADVVTTPTVSMRDAIQRHTGVTARVIYDPYEFPQEPARFNPNGPMKVLWYGSPTNLDSLDCELKNLDGYMLQIISTPIPLKGPIQITPWSIPNMLRGLHECDVVIIPTKPNAHKEGKSTNRMVEAIRQGRFVVANWLPSYQQFGDWMWLGNIKEGLTWAERHPEEVLHRIKGAQKYIEERFAPATIARKWELTMKEAIYEVCA